MSRGLDWLKNELRIAKRRKEMAFEDIAVHRKAIDVLQDSLPRCDEEIDEFEAAIAQWEKCFA